MHVKTYARQWTKKEDVELDTLSEWIKSIGEVVKRRIRRLKHSVNTRSESIFRDPDVVRELSRLHENFFYSSCRQSTSNNHTFCLQETLRRHLDRGTWTPFTSWKSYIRSDRFFLHQRCWTTTNRSSPPSEYSQIVRSSIRLTFTGFRRCTKVHINIDSLRVHQSVRPSLYPFYSHNCLHILSKVFRSTARQPTQEVDQSDVDPQEFKRIIRSSKISKFQPYHKHQVFWFFDPLHNHSAPKT